MLVVVFNVADSMQGSCLFDRMQGSCDCGGGCLVLHACFTGSTALPRHMPWFCCMRAKGKPDGSLI